MNRWGPKGSEWVENYLYQPLPQWVEVAGRRRAIYTDWRDWVRFTELISDRAFTQREIASGMLNWFKPEEEGDRVRFKAEELPAAVQALTQFYLAGEREERRKGGIGARAGEGPSFDYAYDAPYLYAAFQECYGIDLIEIPYLHWWKFRWLLGGLSEECGLMKRVGIRATDLSQIKSKEERARIRKLQREVAIPRLLTDEEIGAVFAL